jgi:hypothetical protein
MYFGSPAVIDTRRKKERIAAGPPDFNGQRKVAWLITKVDKPEENPCARGWHVVCQVCLQTGAA